jgi:hypothetical protein
VPDPNHVLLDDRPGVQLGRHVVTGRPDQLHPAPVRLVVRPGAHEGRQEAVMDVQRPSQPVRAQLGRQDLHEASQHDRLRPAGVDQLPQLRERGRLLLGLARRERNVVKRDAVRPGHRGQVGVVADDGRHLHVQLAGGDPSQQVVQAVALPGHQDHDPPPRGRVGDLPVAAHRQPVGDGAEPGPQFVQPVRQRLGQDLLPGEEPAGVRVGVVGGLDDPAAASARNVAMRATIPIRSGQPKVIT